MIRVILPYHLRILANVTGEVTLDVEGPATQHSVAGQSVTLRSVLDALETRYPMLLGTIRDQETHQRRSRLRFFACEEDWSHESPDAPLPRAIALGEEPLLIIGAIAGG